MKTLFLSVGKICLIFLCWGGVGIGQGAAALSLQYSTHLGADALAKSIAVDAAGNAYVAIEHRGQAVVRKLSPTGSQILFERNVGPVPYNAPVRIRLDSVGAIHVVGVTDSRSFPTTTNALQRTFAGGNSDAFIAKLDSATGQVLYSSYFGGDGDDAAMDVAVDAAGNAYVTGAMQSQQIAHPKSWTSAPLASKDGFVIKVNPGGALVYFACLGGEQDEESWGIAVDSSGSAFVTGSTYSPDFWTSANARQKAIAQTGYPDAFILKLNSQGTGADYSTFIGGEDEDRARSIALDGKGNAWICGQTRSTNFVAATTTRGRATGDADIFVAVLALNGAGQLSVLWLGGNLFDGAESIDLDANGSAYIAGTTQSPGIFEDPVGGFEMVEGLQVHNAAYHSSAFVAKIATNGLDLVYSTFLSGANAATGDGLAVDSQGDVLVTGSLDLALMVPYFPTTPGALFSGFAGYYNDGFVTKLTDRLVVPANDSFAQRRALTGSRITLWLSNAGASTEPGEPSQPEGNGGKSLWWSWVAPTNGVLWIDTQGSTLTALVAVYTNATLNALGLVASAADDVSVGPLRVPVVSGVTYQIRLDGREGAGGRLNLHLTFSAPINDDFRAATQITSFPAVLTGSNVDATRQPNEPAHGLGIGSRSIWWRWQAPFSGPVTAVSTNSDFASLIGVYTGISVDELVSVANPAGSGRITFQAETGMVYHLAVDGSYTESGKVLLNFFAETNGPANDAFANRQVIGGNEVSATSSNLQATFEPNEPLLGPQFDLLYPSGFTVWWSWTAPTNGTFTITTSGSVDTEGAEFDSRLGVFVGNALTNLVAIGVNDDYSGEHKTSRLLLTNIVGGTVYQIAVDGYLYGSPATLIRLNIREVRPPRFVTFGLDRSLGGIVRGRLQGTAEESYQHWRVEGSTAIVGQPWVPVYTNLLAADQFEFEDPQTKDFPRRFYRAAAPP